MLDVHPPHKSIEGVGEFFLHLFTITVGLLIAVGIEAAVERHQAIWQGHLLILKISARVLQEQQSAFLEGREPKQSMSEQLTGR
jgi:hypothetical protein